MSDAGGPVERYRVASRKVCIAAKALGWIAVLAGAGELAVGVVVFNEWVRCVAALGGILSAKWFYTKIQNFESNGLQSI